MDNVENRMILSPEGPNFECRPCETKEDCMTRFFGHGQPIIHVFEIERYIERGEKCEMSIFQPYWTQFREPYPYN